MKVSELIKWLETLKAKEGDIELYKKENDGRSTYVYPIKFPTISIAVWKNHPDNGKPYLEL